MGFWSPSTPNANVHTHAHDYLKSSSCPSFTTATKLFITSAVAPQMSTHVDATRKSERYPKNLSHFEKLYAIHFIVLIIPRIQKSRSNTIFKFSFINSELQFQRHSKLYSIYFWSNVILGKLTLFLRMNIIKPLNTDASHWMAIIKT